MHFQAIIAGKPRRRSLDRELKQIITISSAKMGWWSQSSPQKDKNNETQSTNAPEVPPQAPPPKQLTPDQQAELEFSQILADLRAEEDTFQKKLQQQKSDPNTPDQPSSAIAPDSLYQDSMSCRQTFDYAFFCQSFGGQFVNVYRYGEMRSCSEHWDNFWLCMKTRGWGDELRRKTIRDHNRKKAIKYKTGPSSEDIWDVRLEPAQNAFQGDFAALEREIKAEEEAAQKAKA
ncbi:unnamed protein product [Penicillium manginii]